VTAIISYLPIDIPGERGNGRQGNSVPLIKCPACEREISSEAQSCPHCGHPVAKVVAQQAKQAKQRGCLTIGLGLIALIIAIAIIGDLAGEKRPAFDAQNPNTITVIISEPKAHAVATFANGNLSLIYSIDPWLLTASTGKFAFLSDAKTFFKDAFTSPVVQYGCIEGTATFKDIRGNERQEMAIELCMSRADAAGVNWDGFDQNNLPSIADRSFVHPAFNK
jgi:hypothetical protein